jgi:hypothetical protein
MDAPLAVEMDGHITAPDDFDGHRSPLDLVLNWPRLTERSADRT